MKRIMILMVAQLLAGSSAVWAGGLYLYELSVTDVSLAGAGIAARANDASTALGNPAGMSRLEQAQFDGMIAPIFLQNEFHPTDSQTTTEGEEGDATDLLPSGSFYYVDHINDEFSYGLSLAGYFGLGLDYGSNWVGRYHVTDVVLQSVGLEVALSYQVNEAWSVGVAPVALFSTLEQRLSVNNPEPGLDDARLKLDDTDFSLQVILGIMYEHSANTRFGMQYLTETDVEFEPDTSFSGLGPLLDTALKVSDLKGSDLEISMTLPQSLLFSFYHQLDARLALLGSVAWQEWSEFGKVDVGIYNSSPTNLTADRAYQDTWHGSLGVIYELNPWTLSAGASYDSSMVRSKDRTPDLPLGDSWRFGFGGKYGLGEDTDLKLGYELLWLGDMSMDVDRGPLAGRVEGEYRNGAMHFFAVGLNRRF